jgi:asparagine synthase (glutamine-hydrolysing)
MCGIFGTLNYPIVNPQRVFEGLLHRGPDGQGSFRFEAFAVWHTRLAIQEPGEAGHQPMQYGRWVLAFNGEIYNHRELRKQFGLICRSGSDAETLLHLWERLGEQLFVHLEGMFAFALYDIETQQLWLARDRFGQKPLYVWQQDRAWAFSSELPVLTGQFPLAIDRDTLSQFCQVGYFLPGETPYQHVRLLRPGHWMRVDTLTGKSEERRWVQHQTDTTQPPVLPTIRALKQAVHRQLDSADREVGVLLSGGIDSGLITALAAQHRPRIQTFTMSFAGSSYDEAPLARILAERYQTRHTEVRLETQNLAEEVLNVLPRYGEPFMDSSALPCFWVARAASEHVPVALTGDGSDEFFGGYRRYALAHMGLYRIPPWVGSVLREVQKALPYSADKKASYSHLLRLMNLAGRSDTSRYLAATTDVLVGYESALINPAPLTVLDELIGQTASLSALQQLQTLDQKLLLPGDLLKKMDIASLANGLEARNPFLDGAVVQSAQALLDYQKVGWQQGRFQTKLHLRQLAREYLPPALWNQPKRGFEVPLLHWINGPLRALTHDYLTRPTLVDSLVQPAFVRQLLEKPQNFPPEKRAKILWMLLSVEIWNRHRHG